MHVFVLACLLIAFLLTADAGVRLLVCGITGCVCSVRAAIQKASSYEVNLISTTDDFQS